MARCFDDGDENNAKDMSQFIRGVGQIREATGAAVLVIHHTTKVGNQERGSGALRGAADTMLMLSGKNTIKLSCTKQRDAGHFDDIHMRLVIVELGDGSSSCAVQLAAAARNKASLNAKERKALEALQKFGEEGLAATSWENASGLPQKTFYRARERLVDSGYVGAPEVRGRGAKYHLTEMGLQAVTVI